MGKTYFNTYKNLYCTSVYFEITEYRSEKTDAQGNLYWLQIVSTLSLKEQYSLANTDEYPSDVAIGYTYDRIVKQFERPCAIDFENFTCNVSATFRDESKQSIMAHFPEQPNLYDFYATADPALYMPQILTSENFEILNASGTLYLVKN